MTETSWPVQGDPLPEPIHFIGIGGSGLSAIARLLLESGLQVTGSDRSLSPLARELAAAGARVMEGHHAENVRGAGLVVRSSAVPDDNVEVQAALAAGIPVLKRAQFLGRLMENRLAIAVAGTHGKTTTTAMIAWALVQLGLDPSYIIGGTAKNLGGRNAHAGTSPLFVIEADEYDRMFLGLSPDVIAITYLEHDHPDCFPTPESYQQAFVDFVQRLRPGGALLVSQDNAGAHQLRQSAPIGTYAFGYGTSPAASYTAENLAPNRRGGFDYDAYWQPAQAEKVHLAHLRLQAPGEHNVRNSLAALAVVHRLVSSRSLTAVLRQAAAGSGSDVLDERSALAAAAEALGAFQGTGRRFDVLGEAHGVTVIDDYAHHPTEIQATLSAARTRYPGRRIWAVWQPHTFSRTRALLDEFARSFEHADQVLVTEVYAAREKAHDFDNFSAAQVVEIMRQAHGARAQFSNSLAETGDILLSQLRHGDVLLVLSAGDADQVSARVLAGLGSRKPAASPYQALRAEFGDALAENVSLAGFTTARLGGPADALLTVNSASELEQAVRRLWDLGIPFHILGVGSNVLISDEGLRGVTILNRARAIRIDAESEPPVVWAESGALIGTIARQAALRGLNGFEWAATVPGTLGGAVYGNAGAFGGDMQANLVLAEILHPTGKEQWPVDRMQYTYRSSLLKRESMPAVVLSARLRLGREEPQAIQARMEAFSTRRRATQPPGASMGSMFKNPPGDYAGRLIEAAGLKGLRVGDAEISPVHANFFINHGSASAADVGRLIATARDTVAEQFGTTLELEVELLGNWSTVQNNTLEHPQS